MRKEIKEFKLKFLAQEMELKEDQQKKFFEFYNAMMEERHRLMREKFALEKKLQSKENATDAEYREVMTQMSKVRDRELELEKKYDKEFSQFLTQKQIFKMKTAEEKFNNKMREMHHKKKIDKK